MKIRMFQFLNLSVLLLLICIKPINATPVESVEIISSQTLGPAPLSVHFDVAKVLHNNQELDPFRDINYSWNFGDDQGEYWATNQKPKNTDQGFITGHIFETPGHYEVSVEISSKAGVFESIIKTISVEVTDPDEFYFDENTICFSMSGDFTACPDNAQQVQLTPEPNIDELLALGQFKGSMQKEQRIWNPYKEYALNYDHNSTFEYLDYEQQWDCQTEVEKYKASLIPVEQITPYINSNKRLLFHRGESFIFSRSLYLNHFSGSTLGAFGLCKNISQDRCGNAPILKTLGAKRYSDLLILADGSTDIRVSDLSMTHICGDSNRAINLHGSVSKVTLNRLDIEKFDTAVIGRTYGQKVPHDLIGIFNSKFEKLGAGSADIYDPENTECASPSMPDWHIGDKKTAISEMQWDTLWNNYKLQMMTVLTNNNCKSGGNVTYLPAHRHMIMGTTMKDAKTRRAEHILRMPLAQKSVISHNVFSEPSPNKHALKLHNMGDCIVLDDCDVNPVQAAENYPTSRVLIKENLFKSNTDIVVNIGPGTSKVGEQVNNIFFESNKIEASGEENQVALVLTGHDSIVENNQMIQNFPTTSWVGVSIDKGRNEVVQGNNNLVNNNHFSVNGSVYMVRLGSEANDTQIVNNQVCATAQVNFIDLNDANLTYSAKNNVLNCTENKVTAAMFHLNFDNTQAPAMDVMNNVSTEVKGNIDLVEGVVGKAVVFDDINDEIIISDPMINTEINQDFSLMFWINVNDFSLGGEAFGRPRLNRQGDISLSINDKGEVLFYINSKHIIPNIVLERNIWSHLALTFNNATRSVKVFSNGREVYQYVFPQNIELFFNTEQEFRLGVGQWRSGSRYFSGMLDEFKFYQSALSRQEIEKQINTGLAITNSE
ncbi:LamG-like jellyroll fold domain-containing protein [Pseudoalteromonas denitrificans]|uniref:PKD domain-containing protein n=1 Tax=Pseudoalteromonas denitrificans DSM 6059 TaxID=1123010 RepID=A0A1I1P3W3_9GAMM|nr:LamG-like jellyroll fold domain-containing protein [Pseudoalteromonas denitrificans]SFD04507.1 PKD domain-containing protein [Pseudoalteromonas denitrificans DSM 6059]